MMVWNWNRLVLLACVGAAVVLLVNFPFWQRGNPDVYTIVDSAITQTKTGNLAASPLLANYTPPSDRVLDLLSEEEARALALLLCAELDVGNDLMMVNREMELRSEIWEEWGNNVPAGDAMRYANSNFCPDLVLYSV